MLESWNGFAANNAVGALGGFWELFADFDAPRHRSGAINRLTPFPGSPGCLGCLI